MKKNVTFINSLAKKEPKARILTPFLSISHVMRDLIKYRGGFFALHHCLITQTASLPLPDISIIIRSTMQSNCTGCLITLPINQAEFISSGFISRNVCLNISELRKHLPRTLFCLTEPAPVRAKCCYQHLNIKKATLMLINTTCIISARAFAKRFWAKHFYRLPQICNV